MNFRIPFLLSLLFITLTVLGQKEYKPSFHVVPLGIKGGIDEKNLSAYLVAPINTKEYICLDAGTINSGLEKAIENKVFDVSAETVLKQYIKGYLISHAHLDHVSGLIINSPADSSKTIYATNKCMKMMENHYFNGETWSNFGDEGPGYQIKKYHFQTLKIGQEVAITNTSMTVKPFTLSHVNPFESTAFLIKSQNNYLLYLGDTGSDKIEKSDNLHSLWKTIAPLIQNNQLKAIFIETSFPNEQPDTALFGHLTPKLLLEELLNLSKLTGKKALKGFKVVVTHLKPPTTNIVKIKEQLNEANTLEINFIFPVQGVRLEF